MKAEKNESGYRYSAAPESEPSIHIARPPIHMRLRKWWKEYEMPRFWTTGTFWAGVVPLPLVLMFLSISDWGSFSLKFLSGLYGTYVLLLVAIYFTGKRR